MKLFLGLSKTVLSSFLLIGAALSSAGESERGGSQDLGNKYRHLDPKNRVSRKLLREAVDFYEDHANIIRNKDVISIIDYGLKSSEKRFFVIDMRSGKVDAYLTAHGKGSDPNHKGYATRFSNVPESKMSSLGFALTGETYYGDHGYSLRLDGLSSSNSLDRSRSIVIHSADYVGPLWSVLGRSFGCPAVEKRYLRSIVDRIKGRSLLYKGFDPSSRQRSVKKERNIDAHTRRVPRSPRG